MVKFGEIQSFFQIRRHVSQWAKAPVGPAMRAGSSSDVFPELGSEGSGAYCEEDQGVAAAFAASTCSSSSYPTMVSNQPEVVYAKVDKYRKEVW